MRIFKSNVSLPFFVGLFLILLGPATGCKQSTTPTAAVRSGELGAQQPAWDARTLSELKPGWLKKTYIGDRVNGEIRFNGAEIGIDQFEDGKPLSTREELWTIQSSFDSRREIKVVRTVFTHLGSLSERLPTVVDREEHSIRSDNLMNVNLDAAENSLSFDLLLKSSETARCTLRYSIASSEGVYLESLRCLIAYRNTAGDLQMIEKRASSISTVRHMPFRFPGVIGSDISELLGALRNLTAGDSDAFRRAAVHSNDDLNRLLGASQKKEDTENALSSEFIKALLEAKMSDAGAKAVGPLLAKAVLSN